LLTTRLPDCHATARNHFLNLHPADLTLTDFVDTLSAIETCQRSIAQSSGTAPITIFQGCAPARCTYSDSSAAVAEIAPAAETIAAAIAKKNRPGKGRHFKAGRGGGSGGGGGGGGGGEGGLPAGSTDEGAGAGATEQQPQQQAPQLD
ncbi:hypothetical protein CLOM_g10225, partial [Closterium sp. NIES-68]